MYALKKFCDLRDETEKRTRSVKMELFSVKHRERSFDETMVAANKKLHTSKVKRALLRLSRDAVVLKLKILKTGVGEFLKVVSGRNTEGSFVNSKNFETEMKNVFEHIFAEFKYEAIKFCSGMKNYLSESASGAQRESTNCAGILSNRLASVLETCSGKPSASVSGTSAAFAGTALSTAADKSSKGGSH